MPLRKICQVCRVCLPNFPGKSTSGKAQHFLPESGNDTLLQSGYIGLGNSQQICNFLLRALCFSVQTKAHGDDLFFTGRKDFHGRHQQTPLGILFNGAHHYIRICAQYIAEQQLVAVPVGIQRFIKGYLALSVGIFAQIHQYFVFNTSGCVGSQLDVFCGLIRTHSFNQSDGTNRNQIFNMNTGILKTTGYIYHQTKIVFDQFCTRLIMIQMLQQLRFSVAGQRRRKSITSADVKNDLTRCQTQLFRQSPQILQNAFHFPYSLPMLPTTQ